MDGSDDKGVGRRSWVPDRFDQLVVVVASLVYGAAWGWRTRPMGDSWDYRRAADVILSGWSEITDRTPGYPLVLWATGSLQGETRTLFLVQLLMHAAVVWLVLDVLRSLGVGWRGRTVAAAALFAPPGMLAVVATGTEATVQLLLAAGLWWFTRWYRTRATIDLVVIGVLFAATTWVRPSYAPVVAAAAAVVWLVVRPAPIREQLRTTAAVLVPAALCIGALVGVHGVRFGEVSLTPLTGWYLGSRTSGYVERLPERFEPARSILVAERDRQLLLGGEVDAPNYSFAVREELEQALGMNRSELDRYMLELNLYLLVRHPFEYQAAVTESIANYLAVDSQPAVSRLPVPVAWTVAVLHLGVAVAFLVQLMVVPGLALVGRLRRYDAAVWAYSMAVPFSVMLVSVMTETGTPRLRTPTEPLLVAALILGWSAIVGLRSTNRRPADDRDTVDDALNP